MRRETERWYAEFDDLTRELLGRFRKNKDVQHLPAWWELYVHRLFVCLGYEVTVHPELPGRPEKPDFLVTRGTESLCVEATTGFNGDYKVNPQGQAWVEDFIDGARNPDFMVDIEFPTTPNFGKDIEKIRAKLDEKGGNKYSSLDQPLDKPLVVALQLWHHVDEFELRNVLFGTEKVEWLVDNATGSVVPESLRNIRVPDGYWRPTSWARSLSIEHVGSAHNGFGRPAQVVIDVD